MTTFNAIVTNTSPAKHPQIGDRPQPPMTQPINEARVIATQSADNLREARNWLTKGKASTSEIPHPGSIAQAVTAMTVLAPRLGDLAGRVDGMLGWKGTHTVWSSPRFLSHAAQHVSNMMTQAREATALLTQMTTAPTSSGIEQATKLMTKTIGSISEVGLVAQNAHLNRYARDASEQGASTLTWLDLDGNGTVDVLKEARGRGDFGDRWDASKLLTKVDASGDRNGVVSFPEMSGFFKTFDTDGDDWLSGADLDRYGNLKLVDHRDGTGTPIGH